MATIKERVEQLEQRIEVLEAALRAARNPADKDWRRTIGAFSGDEGMREIFREATRLRKADRRATRAPAKVPRKVR